MFIGELLITKVYASVSTACTLVPGSCSAGNEIEGFIAPATNILVGLSAGLSVLFVVWGGAQMILSFGDDSKVSQGRNSVIWALAGLALTLASQVVVAFVAARASAISTGTTFNPLIESLTGIVASMVMLFNITFGIVIIAAGFRMVLGRGESDQFEAGRRMVIWAIAGAIVANLANALVSATTNLMGV